MKQSSLLNRLESIELMCLTLFVVSVRCTHSSFCLIYFHLFNLFDLEMERSDATTLQLIELYEKSSYLCDKVAACNWTIAAYMQLYRATLLHTRATKLREKIAGVTLILSSLAIDSSKLSQHFCDLIDRELRS